MYWKVNAKSAEERKKETWLLEFSKEVKAYKREFNALRDNVSWDTSVHARAEP